MNGDTKHPVSLREMRNIEIEKQNMNILFSFVFYNENIRSRNVYKKK